MRRENQQGRCYPVKQTGFATEGGSCLMDSLHVIRALALDYPVLYLDPETADQEEYRKVYLRGEDPETRDLSHYRGSDEDRDEMETTPVGPVRTVTLGNRLDFERVIRGLMGAKEGPKAPVPPSQGAAMLTAFNWPRIRAHLAAFPPEQQNEEFRRFTADRRNYQDMLVVLSRGPYSHVDAAKAGFSEAEWTERSDTIRRYHELTHVICRKTYPQNIDAVRDELAADAVGLAAAFGRFDRRLAEKFLGIEDGKYTGGRLENYTEKAEEKTAPVSAALERIEKIVAETQWNSPFDLIPALMELPGMGEKR